jgi:hypothetical protein
MGMRRLAALLKYATISLIALLLLAWIAGLFVRNCGVRLYLHRNQGKSGQGMLWFGSGKVGFTHLAYVFDDVPYVVVQRKQPLQLSDATGFFHIQSSGHGFVLAVPICCVLTALLPLAIGSFTRFQFSIRMWMAWTALIGIQCAYFASVWFRSQ